MSTPAHRPEPVPVLVLDDRGDLARATLPEPWRGHVFQTVQDALAGFAHLDARAAVAWLDDHGLDLARRLASRDPTLPVLVVSARPTVDAVCQAMRLGVRDVIPFSAGWQPVLGRALDNALAWRLGLLHGVEAEVRELREAVGVRQRRVEALEERQRELQVQLAAEASLVAQTQQQLEIQRERALSAVRAKGRFLANVGHELHTPLQAIVGYAEVLREAGARAGAEHIIGAARRLLALLDEVLHLARLEAGEVNPVFEPVAVADLVQACAQRVAPAAAAAGVELAWGPLEVEQIVTDPARLCEALVHLLDNAVKFSARHQGGGRVQIAARRELTEDRSDVVLAIQDDGIGVRPDEIERMVEAFLQGDAASARQHGGTGLGLAVATQLVRVLGGRIGAESPPGGGSTFTVRLPEVAVTSVAGAGSGLTVLVVDDDPVLRTLLQRMLLADGHTAVVTGLASDAVELARAHRPALIALDLRLPGRDGWAVLDDLRADPMLTEIPVVILSADPEAGRSAEAGACAFLRKPVDRGTLRRVLAEHARREEPVGLVVGPPPACVRRLLEAGAMRQVGAAELVGALAEGRPPWVLLPADLDEGEALRALDTLARWGRELTLVTVDEGLPAEQRAFLERRLHAVLAPDVAVERLRVLGR